MHRLRMQPHQIPNGDSALGGDRRKVRTVVNGAQAVGPRRWADHRATRHLEAVQIEAVWIEEHEQRSRSGDGVEKALRRSRGQ